VPVESVRPDCKRLTLTPAIDLFAVSITLPESDGVAAKEGASPTARRRAVKMVTLRILMLQSVNQGSDGDSIRLTWTRV